MPLIRTRFQRHADQSAGAVPRLGVHTVCRDYYFLHGVGIRYVAVLVSQADGSAVYLKVVLQIGATPEVDAVRGPGMERHHLSTSVHRRGSKQRQLERIAVESGNFFRKLRVDDQIPACGSELYSDGSIRHGHGLLNATCAESCIHGHVVPALDQDIFLNERSEPGRFDGDRIRSRIHQIEQVQARLARFADDIDPRIHVVQGRSCARNYGSARVGDNAGDFGAIVLSLKRRDQAQR